MCYLDGLSFISVILIFMEMVNKSSFKISAVKNCDFAFIIAKTLPVVKLFDVKDDWTDFSCDFTKAFWIWSCVVFSMSPVKEQKVEEKKKKKRNCQSLFCPRQFKCH